jgi:hypothetical protein
MAELKVHARGEYYKFMENSSTTVSQLKFKEVTTIDGIRANLPHMVGFGRMLKHHTVFGDTF